MKRLMLSLLFVSLISQNVAAQSSVLQGRVTDAETGHPLPGANVVVTAVETRTGAATNLDGDFRVPNLPFGNYSVEVSFIGYATGRKRLELSSDVAVILNFALKPVSITLNPVSISASKRPEKTLNSPASISVIEPREIALDVAPSSAAILRNTTGVDMATTGIDRNEIVLRGFNNAFSGSAYILTDYRRAAVPSLDVNLHSIMPNMALDLERVEVVRGPGSALYGAGVDAGVIHYLTKNPFDHPGTAVSFGGGERSSVSGSFRHAGVLGPRFGYKLTGQFAQADDWVLSPNDSLDAEQLQSDQEGLTRNNDYKKLNVNGLVQYKWSDVTTLSLNGGFSTLDATVLSGIGTVQADDFGYTYAQMRLRSGGFFAQAYVNRNSAGESFVYGTGDRIIDKSSLFSAQTQYDTDFSGGRHRVTFGADYDRTNPVTEASIFGIFEDEDLISEFGLYAQSLTEITPKLDLTLAVRGDLNNIESGLQISPRAALVFKATPKHSFRATYNRAYDLPAANSLFLDIVAQVDTLGDGMLLTQRGLGSVDGHTFDSARAGGGITASALLPVEGVWGQPLHYSGIGVPERNVAWGDVYQAIFNNLSSIPTDEIQRLLAENQVELSEENIEVLLGLLSPSRTVLRDSAQTQINFAPIDIEPLKSTITHGFEVGYKGLIGEKLLFAADAYYMIKKNFVSGATQVTPQAVYTDFVGGFQPAMADAIRRNFFLNLALGQFDVPADTVAALLAEIAAAGGIEELGVGVVQTDQVQVPGQIVGAFRNFGTVDFWGLDLTLQYLATDNLSLFANASLVSDDFFDDNELEEPGTGLNVALNATGLKWKAGFSYSVPKGISLNSSIRFTKGFPVLSGPYVGNVEDYFLWDLGAGYDFGKFARDLRLDVMVQNLLNDEHREFIGAPRIGRLALARLSYSLP